MVSIARLQSELIKASQAWALGAGFDAGRACDLRRQAVLLNHACYLKNIPAYKKLAEEEGVDDSTEIDAIKRKLMFPDGIFKSYHQAWLDEADFSRMNGWLSGIYHRRINTDIRGVKSIDEWLERLSRDGILVTFSSGTSGAFSFVPRDKVDRSLAATANICYLMPLLSRLGIAFSQNTAPLKQAVRLLSPDSFRMAATRTGLPGFDAFFLGFRHGRNGNQALMQELAPVFRRHCFLYDTDLNASTLRALRRGARSDEERQAIADFRTQIGSKSGQYYLHLLENISESVRTGQKVFIFGTPFQFKKLVESASVKSLSLAPGSVILFGGGWKSFTGDAVQPEELTKELVRTFDVPPSNILEGYSMTEVSMLMLRCEYGRFHIPPVLEPVILDGELNPLEGTDLKGTFGFLDPLARSYPGFIISGDLVHLLDGDCRCGLTGPAVNEISRPGKLEVKGCGGIMSSITA
jgi:hypothetical protein